MPHVVLYEPEIPPNTGNVGRLCLATGSVLHLVGRLGFDIDDRALKRAGLDYWHRLEVRRWMSWEEYADAHPVGGRTWFFTTKAQRTHWDAALREEDHLVLGPETRGLPQSLLDAHPEQLLQLPMRGEGRSLNLATSAGIAVYEALRPK